MKKIILTLSAVIVSGFLQAQWYPLPTGSDSHILSVQFANEQIGWIAGFDNMIMKSEDGGESWDETAFHGGTIGSSEFRWYDVFAVNENELYTCGSKFIWDSYKFNYAYTTNGGNSWSYQTNWGNQAGSWRESFFIDDQTGWKVGTQSGKGWIGRTTTGLEGFTNSPVFEDQSLRSIHFIDKDIGWVAGRDGFISKSVDGGVTWTDAQTGWTQDFENVFFINSSTGWVVGHENDVGIILISTDGGITWTTTNHPDLFSMHSIHFIDDFTGWACGSIVRDLEERGVILYTNDGGKNWEEQYVCDQLSELYSVFFIDEKTGWAAGYDGIMFKTTNAGGTNFEGINESGLIGYLNIYPNPFFTSTAIEYNLNSSQTVTLTFYNQFGKQVDRIEQKQSAGTQQVVWTPELPGGVYYFRLEAGEKQASGKVVLVR